MYIQPSDCLPVFQCKACTIYHIHISYDSYIKCMYMSCDYCSKMFVSDSEVSYLYWLPHWKHTSVGAKPAWHRKPLGTPWGSATARPVRRRRPTTGVRTGTRRTLGHVTCVRDFHLRIVSLSSLSRPEPVCWPPCDVCYRLQHAGAETVSASATTKTLTTTATTTNITTTTTSTTRTIRFIKTVCTCASRTSLHYFVVRRRRVAV